MTASKRTYTKRARAESERKTRQSIVDSTLALWAEVGPAATTISAVARRCGVQRLTVYRHYDDDATLTRAAWQAHIDANPLPDPADWASIDAPAKRLRRALRAVYSYYAATGGLLAAVLHDARRVAALEPAAADYRAWLDGVVATLEAGWVASGRKRDKGMPVSLIELAVGLSTWNSLSEAGLDERKAARLFARAMRGLTVKGGGR
jgi:AcrR family transcriptional regulator